MGREKKQAVVYNPVVAMFVAKWATKALFAVFILFVSDKLGKYLQKIIKKEAQKENISHHRHLIIDQIAEAVYYIAIGLGVVMALINMGVQTTSLLTITGTLLVTTGLALQNVLTTFASGISIAINEPFQVGDEVEICIHNSLNRFEGKVKAFNIYLLTLTDNKTKSDIYIPNNIVGNNIIHNLSRP